MLQFGCPRAIRLFSSDLVGPGQEEEEEEDNEDDKYDDKSSPRRRDTWDGERAVDVSYSPSTALLAVATTQRLCLWQCTT